MPHRKKFRLAAALLGLGVLLLVAVLAAPPDMLAETLKEGLSQKVSGTRTPNEQTLVGASASAVSTGEFSFLEEIGWKITEAYVAHPGRTAVITEGTLQDGFIVKALAVNPNNTAFTTGILEMKLSAFSPAQDMPGQKAGKWYVHGEWKITDANAGPEVAQYRYGPHTFKGVVNLELDYNPLNKESQTIFLSQAVHFADPGETIEGQAPQAALLGNTRFNDAFQLAGDSLLAPAAAETEGGQ
ncbi:MAG: hypothetical protein H6659_15395 [Ardenticatenaceae bacterium]|nr:hypothetical protein [Ardenticatenaceae bacterium]